MGRYDGEEYPPTPACKADKHRFGMNGICFHCRRSKTELVSDAKKTLELYAMPSDLEYMAAVHEENEGRNLKNIFDKSKEG